MQETYIRQRAEFSLNMRDLLKRFFGEQNVDYTKKGTYTDHVVTVGIREDRRAKAINESMNSTLLDLAHPNATKETMKGVIQATGGWSEPKVVLAGGAMATLLKPTESLEDDKTLRMQFLRTALLEKYKQIESALGLEPINFDQALEIN